MSVSNVSPGNRPPELKVLEQKDSKLEKLREKDIRKIIDYIKALKKNGLLTNVREYNEKKDNLNLGDTVVVIYDNKDREIIYKQGTVTNGYKNVLHKKVRIIEIDPNRGAYRLKVKEIVDNEDQKPSIVWISEENVLIIED